MMKNLALAPCMKTKRMKAIRFFIINIPGRVISHSRYLLLRLSKGHPDRAEQRGNTNRPSPADRGNDLFLIRQVVVAKSYWGGKVRYKFQGEVDVNKFMIQFLCPVTAVCAYCFKFLHVALDRHVDLLYGLLLDIIAFCNKILDYYGGTE